jgi:hypothetical protein
MTPIQATPLPQDALLAQYTAPAYTDCFIAHLPGPVALAAFVTAFYTTRLFKAERLVLSAVGHPSTDAEAATLARGEARHFAAWTVEAQRADQLLMADASGRTRSWFCVRSQADGGTALHFGSAVLPRPGTTDMGVLYRLLLGPHKAYSRALLRAAVARLGRA